MMDAHCIGNIGNGRKIYRVTSVFLANLQKMSTTSVIILVGDDGELGH